MKPGAVRAAPEAGDAAARTPNKWGDLLPRVVSGLALAGIALGMTWAGVATTAVLVLAIGLVMSWEWSLVVRKTGPDSSFFVQCAAIALAIGLVVGGYGLMAAVALLVGAIILVPMRFGNGSRLSVLGLGYVGVPVVCLMWLRQDSEPYGFLAVLLVFLVVWATDTAAFLAGRSIGGAKLWPEVSPRKTWSGLIGGLAGSVLAGGLFAITALEASPARLALIGFGLGAVAQAGDLAESFMKRVSGVKDSSNLIPGHGGFLDRMDSIVTAVTAAALLAALVDLRSPARALLLGI